MKSDRYSNIYQLGKYINKNLKKNKSKLLYVIKNIYYKYENIEYPIILERNCAAEMYLNFYIDKYLKSEVEQDCFWEYIRIISELFTDNFQESLNNNTKLDKVNDFFRFIKSNNPCIYKLCVENKLIVLLHDNISKQYKGSFNEEKYINNQCSVINIYENDDNLDYIFILAHELGHFIEKNYKSELTSVIETYDIEMIADSIAIIILENINYDISKLKIDDRYLCEIHQTSLHLVKIVNQHVV